MTTHTTIRENRTLGLGRVFQNISRANRVLAKVRHKQLELALEGRAADSALYARRACRVRRQIQDTHNCSCNAA